MWSASGDSDRAMRVFDPAATDRSSIVPSHGRIAGPNLTVEVSRYTF